MLCLKVDGVYQFYALLSGLKTRGRGSWLSADLVVDGEKRIKTEAGSDQESGKQVSLSLAGAVALTANQKVHIQTGMLGTYYGFIFSGHLVASSNGIE